MTIVLAVVAGGALGFVLSRGDFCFHSTWRRLFQDPPHTSLLRAYATLLLVATPVVQIFLATDLLDPFIPPFTPWAAIIGGLIFGIGMVIAQTCVSGMFYKLGSGMLGMIVAIVAWAIGDLLVWRGGLSGLRTSLTERVVTTSADDGSVDVATMTSVFGAFGVVLVIVAALAIAAWVMRDDAVHTGPVVGDDRPPPLDGIPLGVATGGVIILAWLLVRWHGFDYAYGTSSVPSQLWGRIVDGTDTPMWIPVALISVVPGALAAAVVGNRLWVRDETAFRYIQLGAGGLVMGVGAGIAGGCNLGHSMVGVPLLSIGSIVTTIAIATGVWVGHRASQLIRF
ncbi:MAG: YeeE/YedE thiosulfate transporter family protein [Actinomycetota bacterium]